MPGIAVVGHLHLCPCLQSPPPRARPRPHAHLVAADRPQADRRHQRHDAGASHTNPLACGRRRPFGAALALASPHTWERLLPPNAATTHAADPSNPMTPPRTRPAGHARGTAGGVACTRGKEGGSTRHLPERRGSSRRRPALWWGRAPEAPAAAAPAMRGAQHSGRMRGGPLGHRRRAGGRPRVYIHSRGAVQGI